MHHVGHVVGIVRVWLEVRLGWLRLWFGPLLLVVLVLLVLVRLLMMSLQVMRMRMHRLVPALRMPILRLLLLLPKRQDEPPHRPHRRGRRRVPRGAIHQTRACAAPWEARGERGHRQRVDVRREQLADLDVLGAERARVPPAEAALDLAEVERALCRVRAQV